MSFNSMTFLWIFLPIVLILYYLTKNKYRNILLVIVSIIMYSWKSPETVSILIFSIIVNYMIGRIMDWQKNHKNRKKIFTLGLIFNISLLCFFKYYNFFVENINNVFGKELLKYLEITLPLGISFFTFSEISYIFDLYRKEVKVQNNIINFALYVSFFPKLTMGPIERYQDFEYYIQNKDISIKNFSSGIKKFVYGLSKKVIIANSMAVVADNIFNANISNLTMLVSWIGAVSYMMQIYFDFSGYSDMAIGLGRMFGFNLKENFNLPYISSSITEFWRRWHISLSSWFKNYLYIPLGGNRKGKLRTYINLFIVFLITGLWHGSAWNFIIWGIFNGFFMIIERIKLKDILEKNKFKILNYLYTLIVILISWVLFRANNLEDGIIYIKNMFGFNNGLTQDSVMINTIFTKNNIIIFIVSVLLSGILQTLFKDCNKMKEKYEIFIEPIIVIMLFIISIMYIVNGTYSSYIYSNF